MKTELHIAPGTPDAQRVVLHTGEKALLGRGTQGDIQIGDGELSRLHCLVSVDESSAAVFDLNSRNGTFLNENPVQHAALRDGDVIRLGNTRIEVAVEEGEHPEELDLAFAGDEDNGSTVTRRMRFSDTGFVRALSPEEGGEKVRWAQQHLALIYRLGNQLNAGGDPREVCRLLTESLLNAVPADRALILLAEDDGRRIKPFSARFREPAMREHNPTISRTVIRECLRQRCSVMSSDPGLQSDFKASDSVISGQIGAVMCVPLETEGKIFGLLYLDCLGQEKVFKELDLALVTAIGRQAGLALARVRTIAELEKRVARLDSIRQLTETMASVTGPERFLERVAEVTKARMGVDMCAIWLLNPDGETLALRGSVNVPEEWQSLEIKVGESLSGRVVAQGRAMVFPDISREPGVKLKDIAERDSVRTMVAMPLKTGERTIGVLNVYKKSRYRPSAEDLTLLSILASEAALCIERLKLLSTLRQSNIQLHKQNTEMILTLAGIVEMRDEYLSGHHERVARLAVRLGEELGLSGRERETLKHAGLLHDIGKIVVPKSILDRPGGVTVQEYAVIKNHVSHSKDVLERLAFLSEVARVVEHHHEWFDGSGYPHGKKGEEIPFLSRILALADAFDAMTSQRPYHPEGQPLPLERALEEIGQHEGSQFDPRVVAAFMSMHQDGRLAPAALEGTP